MAAAACKPDKDISRWVTEFLIRQPISGSLVEKVISKLDVSIVNSDWRLRKKLTLKFIQLEISKKGSLSEKILELLETVEQLDRENGIAVSETIKTAYTAVALECTFIGFFFDVVKRIWRGRVQNLEKLKESELVTDELRECWDDVEAAVWNLDIRQRLLESTKRKNALLLVKDYLEEAMMGNDEPSFLELLARREKEAKDTAKCRHDEKDGSSSQADIRQDLGAKGGTNNGSEQVSEDDRQPTAAERKKGYRRIKSVLSKRPASKGRVTRNNPSSKHDTLSSPEVKQVKVAPKSSQSETLISAPQQDVCNTEASVENHDGDNLGASHPSVNPLMSGLNSKVSNPDVHVEQSNEKEEDEPTTSSAQDHGCTGTNENKKSSRSSGCHNVSKPSLMARHTSACTHEWDDSVNSSSEGTSNDTRRDQTTSTKKELAPPPLTKDDGMSRRKNRRWTAEEEHSLWEGVKQFGRGQWKDILDWRRDVFVGRNEVMCNYLIS
ncbi:hypothetical protein LINPERHAP1_LOCUS3777 [Linum perenne]